LEFRRRQKAWQILRVKAQQPRTRQRKGTDKMSRSNLEYGAIIDADDDNDGDLVIPPPD